MQPTGTREEKKVEYLELIYDLIFVYIIGRNNSLLHHVHDGFIDGTMFLAYMLCTLAVIQIWNYTAYYINLHGRNGLRDHVFLFINMYLLYFIGEGTREHWQAYQNQYHAAWALILLNIGVQYLIELRNHRGQPAVTAGIKRMAAILLTQSVIVIAALPFSETVHSWCAVAAIAFGMIATNLSGRKTDPAAVDFSHLSERAMLYVVFTFGEMIIAIAGYFEGEITWNRIYFSLMAFLIVTGLFLSYGTFYDHIVDREMRTDGLTYMLLHIFMIFALNHITTGLEFMQDEEIRLLPKLLFLISSLVLYYVCLFAGLRYAKKRCRPDKRFVLIMAGIAASFLVLMIVLRRFMQVNIAVTVVYVFGIFLLLHSISLRNRRHAAKKSP
ncbi:MAG: low temperature requirement protein A [Oscillospiraceae bacterium]|nr:low temperature requirement protein A [Oscillospiraceae bacterium]